MICSGKSLLIKGAGLDFNCFRVLFSSSVTHSHFDFFLTNPSQTISIRVRLND